MLSIHRLKDGGLRIALNPDFASTLQELPERLRRVLVRSDFADRVTRRLFPRAYQEEEEEKEAEYRKLLGDDLLKHKLESVKAFEHTLKSWEEVRGEVHLNLAADDFELWLGFVNDMRIVLGTELDIQDDSWERDFDPSHPQAEDMALLHCLGWLEELLLEA
jgi:hypothetical protein